MYKKFLSRKFLVALSGVITGIILLLEGNTAEGISSLVVSIGGYLAAEGMIDAQSVKAAAEKVSVIDTEFKEANIK